MTTETTPRVMTVQRMTRFFDAWDAHDVETIVGFFTPDGAYLGSAGLDDSGTAFHGIDEVRRGVTAFLDTYPDGHYTDKVMTLVGNTGFAQWTFHGTRRDGTTIRYRGVDVFAFEGDLIRIKDAYRKERTAPIGG